MLGAVGAEALGELALGGDQQGLMREYRWIGTKRSEHLDLHGTVRDMVLATDDMGDAKVNVVDDARQQVKPAAVGAADDGIADQLRVEMLFAADEVGEGDWRFVVELEAPVRRDAFGDGRAFGLALVNRRQ